MATDVFQVLKSSTIQSIFKDEWQYLVDHRWEVAEKNTSFLILLDADRLSLHHLDQIQRMIQAEKKAVAEAEKKKARSINLTGGCIR